MHLEVAHMRAWGSSGNIQPSKCLEVLYVPPEMRPDGTLMLYSFMPGNFQSTILTSVFQNAPASL